MQQVLIGNALLNTPSTVYYGIAGNCVANTTEGSSEQVCAATGTVSSLYVSLGTAPGAGKTRTFTLRKNGVDTALTCSISETSTTGNDTSNSVSVTAGDILTIGVTSTAASTNAGTASFSLKFTGNTSNESLIPGNFDGSNTLSASSTEYGNLMGGNAGVDTTETTFTQLVPTGGSISSLYVKLGTAPGAGKSRAFTLMVNGSPSTLTCTVSDANTTANDTTHSVTVAAGDRVTIKSVPTGTPAVTTFVYGTKFTADTDGESISMSWLRSPSTSATNYGNPCGGNIFGATEASVLQLAQACTIKKFYYSLGTAPGVGTSRTFDIRLNSTSPGSNPSITISDANTTGNDTTNTLTVANGDAVDIRSVPTSSPAASANSGLGFVLFITPTVATSTPITSNLLLMGAG